MGKETSAELTPKSKRMTLAWVLILLLMLFGAALFSFFSHKSAPGPSTINPDFESYLLQTARQMNIQAPYFIDDDTRFEHADVYEGNTIRYNFSLQKYKKSELDRAAFEKNIRESSLKNLKKEPEIDRYRENNATIQFFYSDKDGEFFSQLNFKPGDY